MHPDIARQLAAERHADLQREARPLALSRGGRPRRLRLRLGLLARYAGAAAGARSGT